MPDPAQRSVLIFLSYRREDTQWAARGIYERLCVKYGLDNVFRDLDSVPPGVRFREFIEQRIVTANAFVVLIGPSWAVLTDDAGRRRLELPRDPVRIEIEAALRTGIPIIPVRVEGAPMPTDRDLVPSIVDLLEFNAAQVSDARWDYDIAKLLEAIDAAVELSATGNYSPTSVRGVDAPATSPEIGDEGHSEHWHRATTDASPTPEAREDDSRLNDDSDIHDISSSVDTLTASNLEDNSTSPTSKGNSTDASTGEDAASSSRSEHSTSSRGAVGAGGRAAADEDNRVAAAESSAGHQSLTGSAPSSRSSIMSIGLRIVRALGSNGGTTSEKIDLVIAVTILILLIGGVIWGYFQSNG